MGEIKGQLLTMLLVLVAFTAIAGVLYSAINSSSENITAKVSEEISFVANPTI